MERVHQAVRRECARLLDSTLALSLFLANAVVFLPLVLRQGTHRNAIQLSRCVAGMIAHNGTNVNKTRTSACGQRIIHPPLERRGLSDAIFCKCLIVLQLVSYAILQLWHRYVLPVVR